MPSVKVYTIMSKAVHRHDTSTMYIQMQDLLYNCVYRIPCFSLMRITPPNPNPNPLCILAMNLPESSKMPLCSKCTMHFRWSFTFSTYGLYFLPGRNFAPFEEVKVPVSNSAEFSQKKCPLEDFAGFGVVRVNKYLLIYVTLSTHIFHTHILLFIYFHYTFVPFWSPTCNFK